MVMDVCISSLSPNGKKICPIDELPDLDKVEQILKENQDIALVYTTHNETGTGILNPVREIGSLVHKYNAVFIVEQ